MNDHLRGHPIHLNARGEWIYTDTGEPTVDTWRERACGHCGLHNTPEGHDGCLGTLPDVANACCGHGDLSEAYVQMADGSRIEGDEAMRFFREHGRAMMDDATILEKFERLRELREDLASAKASLKDAPTGSHEHWLERECAEKEQEIDTLATALENWARTAEAGEVLDRVCAEFMGAREEMATPHGHKNEKPCWVWPDGAKMWRKNGGPPPYSTDRSKAMELLEALPGLRLLIRRKRDEGIWQIESTLVVMHQPVPANTLPLAIARAAAVLAARGVEVSR